MGDRERTVAVLVTVAAFLAGHLLGNQRGDMAVQDAREQLPQVHLQQTLHRPHDHGRLDLSRDSAIPQVDLIVHKDGMAGRNLEIVTKHFRFSPQHASSEHIAGEGHAHLYLDGKKIARVYGRWFHIPEPTPGTHSIRVTLNSNSHQDLAVDGEVIQDIETITVADH
ncbi:hypothetical protein [Candidatus Thiosymbion oneisti]|uniref:hypothetical protein n=1 Tax=Candidatus Thiosymbion oneisti TaxID=589554 RepID=UPI000A9FD458|nr:hypothetical protein [Candidatus Thiosymbion oneisti]